MFNRLPPVTRGLLIANVAVFLLQWALGEAATAPFMLWPLGDAGAMSFLPWQLLSYGFMHGGFFHLFFNMLVLFMFGAPLEHVWGPRRFLQFYLACILGAGLCQLAVGSWMVGNGAGAYPTVGASGGVLQPGMFSRLRIDYDQRADALVVPRVALLDDGDPAVFVVRDGKAVRVPVKIGYVDGEWIEVREGLKAGEQVVTAGKVALREGSSVQVIGAEPAKVAAKADAAKTAGTKQ